jgi:glycosyltransferase involved in cell wall biosynthesis
MPDGVKVLKIPFISRKYFDKLPLIKRFLFFLPTFELESFSMLPFLLPHLKKVNPDLVLTITLPETIAPLLLGFPTIMMSQAGTWYRLKLYKKADLIIVNEPFSLIRLKRLGFKVNFILNGVEIKKNQPSFLETVRSKYKIPKEGIRILSVARLDSQKRIHLLIEAFKLIKEKATLIIVGEGPELARLQQMCAPIQNKAIFLSRVPHEEILALYKLCDVFSLPSLREACSLAVIEALSAGKPAVTNPEPIKRFLLNDHGIFMNVEDSQKYAEALLFAASKKLDTNSLKFKSYIKKFSWKKISQEYLDVFRHVLKEKGKNV